MNRTELDNAINGTTGQLVNIVFTDGTDLTVVSEGRLNSKGFVYRFHADEPTTYAAPSKVVSVTIVPEDAPAGMTTADIAEALGMTAKELRVHLRALGMGVGKGHKYGLTSAEYRKVRDAVLTVANA